MLDLDALEPYLQEDDEAADFAVQFTLHHADAKALCEKIQRPPTGQEPKLLWGVASSLLWTRDTPKFEQALAILDKVDGAWLRGQLAAQNPYTRLTAAAALAVRGDASGLAATLEALHISRDCSTPQAEAQPCQRSEEWGHLNLWWLSQTLPPTSRLPEILDPLPELPMKSLIRLAILAAQHADDAGVMPPMDSDEEAFLGAGRRGVSLSDRPLAVWDGRPARGKGGTADIFAFARKVGVPVVHINPIDRTVVRFSGARASG